MTQPPAIDVMATGGVLLGPDVVCDGFHCDRPFRVQTHIHDDHMEDFDTSKGRQDLLMSHATRSLLIAERNADLLVRTNLLSLAHREPFSAGRSRVSLISSGHMLGAVQVLVELSGGQRLGYSGDFSWPLDDDQVMRCDYLVIDSTYGTPDSIRNYSQEEAEGRFVELAVSRIKRGPVFVKAHRGTIQRALHLLSSETGAPMICSPRLCREIAVYQEFGTPIGVVVPAGTADATAMMAAGPYFRFYSKGDRFPIDPPPSVSSITLSAFMASRDDPVMTYSDAAYRVALSNHADFRGTLEYVKATGATHVIADNTRGKGIDLANEITRQLGIAARPSANYHTNAWGDG